MASISSVRGPGNRAGIVGINVTPFVDIALVTQDSAERVALAAEAE